MSRTTPRLTKIHRVDIGTEESFAAGSPSLTYLKTLPVDRSSLSVEALEDMSVRATFARANRIMGPRAGTLTLKTYLHGWSASLPVGSVSAHPLWDVLRFAFGARLDGTSSSCTLAAGTDTNNLVGTGVGDLDDLVGGALAFLDTAGKYQVGWVTDYSPTPSPTLTLLQDVPAAAPTGSPAMVYAGSTFAVTEDTFIDAGVAEAIRIQLTSQEETVTCYGCQPQSLKLTLAEGKLPELEMQYGVANWAESAGGPATVGSYPWPLPEPFLGAKVFLGADGTPIRVSELTFDLGLEVKAVPGPAGASGIVGWAVTDRNPRVSFKAYRDLSKEIADFIAQTNRPFSVWWGSRPGKILALCIPAAGLPDYPKVGDKDGLQTSEITLEARAHTDAGTGAIASTSCRLALI